MVVQTEQTKREEQCPLLQMDAGGDVAQAPPTGVSPGWKVACVPKRSWLDRWPEYISACWMTFILLGITFIVFYALGMSAYRRKPLVIVKCNTSKPENNLFFHHVLPRGSTLQFILYSDYLSNMAVEYPFLHINVFFLVDDSLHNSVYGPKHSSMFKKFGSSIVNNAYPVLINEKDKQEIEIFQQRYRNINITIVPLSHYMAMTPLRYKWKMIPIFYLPFYARIFAVWEYGGIALDLTTFNNQYHINQMVDRRITAILKQHNDGIEEKRYIQALNTIDREEETEFFKMFYNLITGIFNNTLTLFDNSMFSPPMTTEQNQYVVTMSRNYRNRHENVKILSNNYTNQQKGTSYNVTNKMGSAIINSTSKNATIEKDSVWPISKIKENDKKNMTTKVANEVETNLYDIIMSAYNISKGENKSLIALKNKETSLDSAKVKKNPNNIENNVTKAPMIKNESLATWTNYPPHNVKTVWKTLFTAPKTEQNNSVNEQTKTKKDDSNLDISKLHINKISTEIPHVVLLYDFSIFSDGVGPSYFLPDIRPPPSLSFERSILKEPTKKMNKPPYLLSISADGNFVAATSRHHPFLSHLLSSGCKRVNPKFAIEDTVFSQCSGFLRNDVYCDNIYILD